MSSWGRSTSSMRRLRCGLRSKRGIRTRRSCMGRRGRGRRRWLGSRLRGRVGRVRGGGAGRVGGGGAGGGGDGRCEEEAAVNAGRAEIRAVIARARERRQANGRHTVLFLDEIHRFNKAQQDALLPAVEEGLLTLIGATTEN